MELDIKPFDPQEATPEEWSAFYQYIRKRVSEARPGDPVEDQETVEEWEKGAADEYEIRSYSVTEKGHPSEVIGWLRMWFVRKESPSIVGNEHILRVNIGILNEHRRQGIGLKLLRNAYDYAIENDKTLVMGNTNEDDGRSFLRVLGAKEALNMRDCRTVLEKIDWSMVDEWEREGSNRSPESTLEIFTRIPDEILEDYCRVYTEVYNQMPFDELEIGQRVFEPTQWRKEEERDVKIGITRFTGIVREKNGEISGLSDVYHTPSLSPLMHQFLTGVHEKYRGTGKGKWLKAAMLHRIKQDFPDIETISTTTATSNAPMLAINERLGFKVHQEMYGVQIETKKIGEYLAKK
ncbi:MAG: GNAT family N-acetyltransferase [Candidatus Thorarchaeota archaeon]